jgi:putative tricarboxylic transport membrane protein
LSKGNTVKGLLAAALGLAVAMIGPDPVAGLTRFDFGVYQFAGGISLIPALIGLFAVSQAFDDLQNLRVGQDVSAAQIKDFRIPWKKIASSWGNILRSVFIGISVGILPGVGGPVASFLSYEQAKQSSKNKEEFGSGAVEGVIASETSNNAVTGGALACLISLGLPGDGATVALLGGLMIHGLRPGPLFFSERPDIVYGIFAAFFIANIIMFVTQYWGIRLYAQILKVPTRILIPIILIMCLIGAYALNRQMFDIWMLLIFGIIGFLFRKTGYPLAPFILAFILEPMIEANLRRAMSISRGSFTAILGHPIAVALLTVGIIITIMSYVKIGQKLKD